MSCEPDVMWESDLCSTLSLKFLTTWKMEWQRSPYLLNCPGISFGLPEEGKWNFICNCNSSIKTHFQCQLNYISNPAISPEDNILTSKLKEDQYDLLGKSLIMYLIKLDIVIPGTHQLARNIIFRFEQQHGYLKENTCWWWLLSHHAITDPV